MDGSSTGEEDYENDEMFEVIAGVVHHEDPSQLTQMTKLIVDYIGLMNAHQATKLNRVFSRSGHISYMTWVVEGIINQDQPWQNWKPRWK
jgi:hypothetical protein